MPCACASRSGFLLLLEQAHSDPWTCSLDFWLPRLPVSCSIHRTWSLLQSTFHYQGRLTATSWARRCRHTQRWTTKCTSQSAAWAGIALPILWYSGVWIVWTQARSPKIFPASWQAGGLMPYTQSLAFSVSPFPWTCPSGREEYPLAELCKTGMF